MDYRWLIDGFEALTSFLLQSSPSLVLFSFFSAWGHCGSQLCHLVIDFSRSVHRPLASVKRLALFAGPYFREIRLNFPFLLLTRTGRLADGDQELSCSATSPRTWVGQPPLLLRLRMFLKDNSPHITIITIFRVPAEVEKVFTICT